MNRIFSPDNLFFRTLARCVDVVGLSLLWLLLCFPVVTIGPATAALYHALCRVFHFHEDEGAFGLFFRSLKANLKHGVLASLILVPFALLLIFLHGIYATALSAEMSGASILAVTMSRTVIRPVRPRSSSTTHRVSISQSRMLAQARRTVISPSTPGRGRMSTSRS